ncbi:MAG: hypothetical protein KJ077_22705 [Anaerolineae bacterium]|nr:hypothetical protein [Anaerolineae bacterium]
MLYQLNRIKQQNKPVLLGQAVIILHKGILSFTLSVQSNERLQSFNTTHLRLKSGKSVPLHRRDFLQNPGFNPVSGLGKINNIRHQNSRFKIFWRGFILFLYFAQDSRFANPACPGYIHQHSLAVTSYLLFNIQ